MNDAWSARLVRRALTGRPSPTEALRLLRAEPGLCALIGDWHHPGAVVGVAPQRVAGHADDPFALADEVPDVVDDDPAGEAFGGGWIGYWGYQLGARLERLPQPPARPLPLPAFHLAYYDHVLRHDSESGAWWFEALLTEARAEFLDRQYDRLERLLRAAPPAPGPYTCGQFGMTPGPDEHRRVVGTTLEHIAAGDIFQANLCVRLQARLDGDPLDVFCAGVDALAPRFGAYLSVPGGAVASLSPELFVRRTGRDVLTSPIKGTAPLDSDERSLASSYKNRAENIMIVDLMRNDLGRVCAAGSVRVPEKPRAERHTGVWHLVSDVRGRLRENSGDADLLRATFPPGSVTGAPKVRAMQTINELETSGREVYTGSVGYVSPCAGLELNVAIRTFEFSGDTVWLGVGGGIVADSDPADELRECLVKASPLLKAINATVDAQTRSESGSPTQTAPDPRPAPRAESPESPPALPRPDPARGVFETLRVEHGTALRLDAHLARLGASLEALYGIGPPEDVRTRITRTAAQLSGVHRLRVAVVPHRAEPVTVETAPLPGGDPAPWRLVPRVLPGGLGPHKWADRGVLDALLPAPDGPDEDVLLLDTDGSVLETGRGNVFVVDDHGVHTPVADERVLPGVTRRRVLDALHSVGIPVFERPIRLDDLAGAEEVFATNALRGAAPVLACGGVGAWRPGPLTGWLARRLGQAHDRVPEIPRADGRRVLLIDNYDSFVYNLDQYCQELGASTTVIRNDAATAAMVEARVHAGTYDRIVISPGPGTPAEAGISSEVVRRLGPHVPILGVCLGHQSIGVAYGAAVVSADAVVHGKTSLVHHDGNGVFAGLDGPLASGRYHSLVVDEQTLPGDLVATAHTASGVLMGVRHRVHPVEGVQLHPESILTGHGHRLLGNFLAGR